MNIFEELIVENKKTSPELNWDNLLKLFKDVDIQVVEFITNNGFGVATYNKIFISNKINKFVESDAIFFSLLHELGHYKSFQKYGTESHVKKISNTNYDEYVEYILSEEMLANRYGLYTYQMLNGFKFQGYVIGYEEMKYNSYFKAHINSMFGRVNESMDNYDEILSEIVKL